VRVYLCGAINNCTDAECKDWREEAKRLLGDEFQCVDPMRRDYRGKELASSPQIVYGDLRDIDSSDYVLVRAEQPSWGTAMEMFYAFQQRKVVIAWTGLTNPSPWVRMHCHHLAPHLAEAVEVLKREVRP
jgi:nucleoside 2-deoxyribosyltransferase